MYAANVSWFVCAAAGAMCLWLMRLTPPVVDRVLKRLAGACFLAGGLAGLSGWVGQAMTACLSGAQRITDAMGVQAVATPVWWIIAAAVGLSWLAGMLPDSMIRGHLPTWLIYSGLVLPALLASVPGRFGQGLRTVTYAAGGIVGQWVAGMVS